MAKNCNFMNKKLNQKVILITSTAVGCTIDLLKSKKRDRQIVDCRRIYCKLLKDAGYSFVDIGKSIGVTHASAIHLVNSCEDLTLVDAEFKKKYTLANERFNSALNDHDSTAKVIKDYITLLVGSQIIRLITGESDAENVVKNVEEIINFAKTEV